MNKFDKEIRELLYDAEMPVSSTLWDKIENRIDTKPDKPKYWMLFLLFAVAVPALFVSLSEKSEKIESVKIADNITYASAIEEQVNYNAGHINQKDNAQKQEYPVDKKLFNTKAYFSESTQKSISNKENFILNNNQNQFIESTENSTNGPAVYDEPLESVLLKFGYIDELPFLGTSNNGFLSSNADHGDERPFIQRLFSAGTECPKFSRKLRGLYAWTNYTSAYVNQSLSADNGEFSDYIARRKDSENSAYSFSTSIGLGYIHASGWFVESGITYDKINTRFHQVEENIIGTEEIIRTSKDEDGNVTGTYTEIIPIIGFNEIKHTNKLTQIEIPLLFGYELPISPGLNLSVKAGPNFNLSSNSSGRIINLEGNPIFFGDDTNVDVYRDKFGVGYIAGAHIVKHLSDKLSFDIGMTYKSYGDMQDSSNPITHNFTKYGLSSGLKYRFL
ncbi:PorT family protein [Saprospiraceae bacterium]|nr:PorT family protein [Saprospiraceae bacterium]